MRDRCSAHSFLQKVKRWHVLCRQWHPKATNTLTLEGRQSHRCTAKIHKIANYFSWALEATFFQHYSREFLTLWSFWGESTSILCCEKPFLSTCALGGVRFHLQPEQFWAVSTKGTAAGFCLLGVLVYEPHAYKDSLRKGTVVAFPFQDTFWFGSRPQDLTLHTDVVTLKKQLADVTLLALVLWVKSKGCVKAKRPHYTPCSYTSPWFSSHQPCAEVVYKENWKPACQGSWWPDQWVCWERFLGFWTGNRGFNRAVRLSSGSTSPQHGPSLHSCMARLPWKGCWKTRWHVRNAELKPRDMKVTAIKTEVSLNVGQAVSVDPPICLLRTPKGWRPGWRACLGNQQLLHCSPRKLLTCMFVGNCTSYFWSWDPVQGKDCEVFIMIFS